MLFCAFCEDRGLLPVDTIRKAYEHRDPYHPRPIWDNFRGLFQAINRGNAALGIHAYNGGLFADDPVLDRLQVSDEVCGYFRDLGELRLPPAASGGASRRHGARLIDVDILGHIFEQSITDLERLRNELDGLAEPVGADKHKTRRKKEGAFYTPAFITRYIIEQALGGVLRDRFEQLRQRHEQDAKGTARTALADPSVYDLDKLKKPAADGAGPVLGSLAGRVGRHPPAGPGLRQRRVPDRSLRPAARGLSGVERPAAGAARPSHAVRPGPPDPGAQPVRRGPERRGHRDLPAEPVDQDGPARQAADQPGPHDPRRQQRRRRPGRRIPKPSTGRRRSPKSFQTAVSTWSSATRRTSGRNG